MSRHTRSTAPRLNTLARLSGGIASDDVLSDVSLDGLQLPGFLPASVRVFLDFILARPLLTMLLSLVKRRS
jgi:hypothetical protein